ncbi:hypothetical protein ACFXKG_05065 [Streptomyces sp. NPDC059255]|uniref:hypothetical protein n=1 Tax=Streptomyces sp. NPDC059255 TaxID=3346793 RepID=UPI0036D0EC68
MGTKILATRHATTAVRTALRLLGNPVLTRGNPLECHFRDIQCAPVHAPQEDTALLAIGTSALSAWASTADPDPTGAPDPTGTSATAGVSVTAGASAPTTTSGTSDPTEEPT